MIWFIVSNVIQAAVSAYLVKILRSERKEFQNKLFLAELRGIPKQEENK